MTLLWRRMLDHHAARLEVREEAEAAARRTSRCGVPLAHGTCLEATEPYEACLEHRHAAVEIDAVARRAPGLADALVERALDIAAVAQPQQVWDRAWATSEALYRRLVADLFAQVPVARGGSGLSRSTADGNTWAVRLEDLEREVALADLQALVVDAVRVESMWGDSGSRYGQGAPATVEECWSALRVDWCHLDHEDKVLLPAAKRRFGGIEHRLGERADAVAELVERHGDVLTVLMRFQHASSQRLLESWGISGPLVLWRGWPGRIGDEDHQDIAAAKLLPHLLQVAMPNYLPHGEPSGEQTRWWPDRLCQVRYQHPGLVSTSAWPPWVHQRAWVPIEDRGLFPAGAQYFARGRAGVLVGLLVDSHDIVALPATGFASASELEVLVAAEPDIPAVRYPEHNADHTDFYSLPVDLQQ